MVERREAEGQALKEPGDEEIGDLTTSPLTFKNKAVCMQLHEFCFLVRCSEAFQPVMHPLASPMSTGIFRALARDSEPTTLRLRLAWPARSLPLQLGTWDRRLLDPPLARLRPARQPPPPQR